MSTHTITNEFSFTLHHTYRREVLVDDLQLDDLSLKFCHLRRLSSLPLTVSPITTREIERVSKVYAVPGTESRRETLLGD
jgi:hypothetical protein